MATGQATHLAPAIAVSPSAGIRPRAIWLPLAAALVGLLVLSPLLWVSVPALVDYPNHLARMWVLAHPHAAAAQNYLPHWQLIPALAMDLVVPALAQIMPIEAAGRLFIAATLVLLMLGTAALHRVLWGRASAWPLAAALFLYNDAFYWGLLNYLFALGVALLGFSGWVATEAWPTRRRVPLFAAFAALLFVLHLFAFGVYGLMLAGYEIGKGSRGRSLRDAGLALAVRLAQFVPAVLLWGATLSNGGPRHTAYGGIMDKLMALTSPLVYGDVGFVVVPVCFGLIYVGWRTRTLLLAPMMRLPIVGLVAAAVLMPNWLFGSWAADVRLPIALAFIGIAATRLQISRRLAMLLGTLALLLLCARVYALTQSWREMDGRFAEFRHAASTLPEGARLLVVQSPIPGEQRHVAGVPEFLMMREAPDFFHMAALSVIDRGAFVPYLFTGWTTVRPTPRNAGRYQSQGVPLRPEELTRNEVEASPVGEPPYWLDWPRKFDFVLWLDFGDAPSSLPATLAPWQAGSFFHLYRIRQP